MRVVLDTNVLLSACLKPEGLEAQVVGLAGARGVELCVSDEVLAEYRDVLFREKFAGFRGRAEALLARLAACWVLVAPQERIAAASDEDDNRFLECACAAGAAFLVTGNLRHFPSAWDGVEVVNARGFLVRVTSEVHESGVAMLKAPNFEPMPWLVHGFGGRNSEYPAGIETVKQIHSARVVGPEDAPCEADALVTCEPGRMVGVRTADCVPVLIVDEKTRAVAAVHAGWRGTAAQIVKAAVAELVTRFGSSPNNLHAAVGPAIGGCCYEVGPELRQQFGVETRTLDLKAINAAQLRAAGVPDVWVSDVCTRCEAGYFSCRREKEQAGRQVSFVGAVNEKG